MTTKFNVTLAIATLVFGAILIFTGQNPMIALLAGGLIWFMVRFLWSPPPKHKDFSDRDRLEAMSRAMGGSGAPPELPKPEIHEKKHHKGKE